MIVPESNVSAAGWGRLLLNHIIPVKITVGRMSIPPWRWRINMILITYSHKGKVSISFELMGVVFWALALAIVGIVT